MNDLQKLGIGGVSPNIIRELSGIFPSFVSAFKELISNAYDANARKVNISVSNDYSEITIRDDGTGMTPYEFQTEYIRIGGSSHYPISKRRTIYRPPIGKKGIGFISIARYCSNVEIHSYSNRINRIKKEFTLDGKRSNRKPIDLYLTEFSLVQDTGPKIKVNKVKIDNKNIAEEHYIHNETKIFVHSGVLSDIQKPSILVDYSLNYRAFDFHAIIDYEYIFNLDPKIRLDKLSDFCTAWLTIRNGSTKQTFTQITLHLKPFVQEGLRRRRRRGNVKNIKSESGIDRFIWELSRSCPIDYQFTNEGFSQIGLQELVNKDNSKPFHIFLSLNGNSPTELKRLIYKSNDPVEFGRDILFNSPIRYENESLKFKGTLLAFKEPIYPAELRGLAIRARGVQIGPPSLLGIERKLPKKYRSLLSHVMGEINVEKGLDAITSILPGRAGFYTEDTNYESIRNFLIGEGIAHFGKVGELLQELSLVRSLEQSIQNQINERNRRRSSLIEVTRAVIAHSLHKSYATQLKNLFINSDKNAEYLCNADDYEYRLPDNLTKYKTIQFSDLKTDYSIDPDNKEIKIRKGILTWTNTINFMGVQFTISLKMGMVTDPIIEFDFASKIIYLNWNHPSRSKMGDTVFIKSAFYWNISYLCFADDVHTMMSLAHSLLSFTS